MNIALLTRKSLSNKVPMIYTDSKFCNFAKSK